MSVSFLTYVNTYLFTTVCQPTYFILPLVIYANAPRNITLMTQNITCHSKTLQTFLARTFPIDNTVRQLIKENLPPKRTTIQKRMTPQKAEQFFSEESI